MASCHISPQIEHQNNFVHCKITPKDNIYLQFLIFCGHLGGKYQFSAVLRPLEENCEKTFPSFEMKVRNPILFLMKGAELAEINDHHLAAVISFCSAELISHCDAPFFGLSRLYLPH